MLQYVEAKSQYISGNKRHQYRGPLVEFLAKFTIRTYTNAFFASHDILASIFLMQIYTFFSIPMPFLIRFTIYSAKINDYPYVSDCLM